jgi:galactitol-specific phosphotransferase system IIC component
MFGLGILKGTIIGLGIGVIASYALKEACKNSNKNKVDKSPNLQE